MLTISISEALQGPAAWSEWGSADSEAVAAAEAWQQQLSAAQWDLDAGHAEGTLTESKIPLGFDPTLFSPWLADPGLQSWSHDGLSQQEPSEAAASLALAAAMIGRNAGAAGMPDEGQSKAAVANEAAFASPLRVPLPEPLPADLLSAAEPLSGLELELLELPIENVFTEPQKVSAPPGLKMHSGPGPLLADIRPGAAAQTATALPQKPVPADHAPPGMSIKPSEVGGQPCTRVDWKIDDFSGKLQASMGRPVVSPAFAACGLSNLRLMVFPDARDAVKSARSHERKGLYAAMVKKGPLYGSLKLKADGLERATVMTFSLLVGSVRAGPSVYDFSEQAVLGMEDFGVDWLQQVDKASGALYVSIEIVEVRQK